MRPGSRPAIARKTARRVLERPNAIKANALIRRPTPASQPAFRQTEPTRLTIVISLSWFPDNPGTSWRALEQREQKYDIRLRSTLHLQTRGNSGQDHGRSAGRN